MLGEKLTPILLEVEKCVIGHMGIKPNYPDEALRAASCIFFDVIMDKMYNLQDAENLDKETRIAMSEKCGEDLRQFVKTYCNIDTHELYKK